MGRTASFRPRVPRPRVIPEKGTPSPFSPVQQIEEVLQTIKELKEIKRSYEETFRESLNSSSKKLDKAERDARDAVRRLNDLIQEMQTLADNLLENIAKDLLSFKKSVLDDVAEAIRRVNEIKRGPAGKNGKDGARGDVGPAGRDGKNPKPEELFPLLFAEISKHKLKKADIAGLEEELRSIAALAAKGSGGGGMGTPVRFSFDGDDSTTEFELPAVPSGEGLAIWAHDQGQWLQPGVHFNVSGTSFVTTYTPATGSTIEGFLIP